MAEEVLPRHLFGMLARHTAQLIIPGERRLSTGAALCVD
jgi:hypothetical protein